MEFIAERCVDELGRLVLPAPLRKRLGWKPDEKIGMYIMNGEVVLRRMGSTCRICGAPMDEEDENILCEDCIRGILEKRKTEA